MADFEGIYLWLIDLGKLSILSLNINWILCSHYTKAHSYNTFMPKENVINEMTCRFLEEYLCWTLKDPWRISHHWFVNSLGPSSRTSFPHAQPTSLPSGGTIRFFFVPVMPKMPSLQLSVISAFNSYPPSAAYMRQWIGSALVQIMACRLFGAKPLSKPTLGYCQLNPKEQTSVKF